MSNIPEFDEKTRKRYPMLGDLKRNNLEAEAVTAPLANKATILLKQWFLSEGEEDAALYYATPWSWYRQDLPATIHDF